jgi:methylglutaconyl-CoA hydratase
MVIIKEVIDRMACLTLNRPEKKNALNGEMIQALIQVLEEMENDPSVKVVVIKGAGNVFCSGADLAQLEKMREQTFEENLSDSRLLGVLFQKIYGYPKVVMAQVQGDAIAGGCGLALACDYVFAVPEARFGFPEVRIGFLPAMVMVIVREKLGGGVARKMLLQGKLFPAAEAKALGMVDKLVEAEDLSTALSEFAKGLMRNNSGQSMAATKKMLADLQGMGFEEGMEHAMYQNALARTTDDFRKGIAAFLSKEKIQW